MKKKEITLIDILGFFDDPNEDVTERERRLFSNTPNARIFWARNISKELREAVGGWIGHKDYEDLDNTDTSFEGIRKLSRKSSSENIVGPTWALSTVLAEHNLKTPEPLLLKCILDAMNIYALQVMKGIEANHTKKKDIHQQNIKDIEGLRESLETMLEKLKE